MLSGGRVCVPANRLAVQAERFSDHLDLHALVVQGVHHGVALAPLDRAQPFRGLRRVVDCRAGPHDDGADGRVLGGLGEALAVLGDALLDGLAQVLPQVVPVRDLCGVGTDGADGLRGSTNVRREHPVVEHVNRLTNRLITAFRPATARSARRRR